MDHACLEVIEDWEERHSGTVYLEMHTLHQRKEADFVHAESSKVKGNDSVPPLSNRVIRQ